MTLSIEHETAARNLLENCLALMPGETLLIVHEDPALGWYDEGVAEILESMARRLGSSPTVARVGAPGNDPDPSLEAEIARYDATIYLARIGDQDRFGRLPEGRRAAMCYARDIDELASRYATTAHPAMAALKAAVDGILAAAGRIEIECPLGTSIAGAPTGLAGEGDNDVLVRRFPLGVPTPLGAAKMSGRVALSRHLTPTGSRVYEPASLALEGVVFAQVEAGRIAGFEGARAEVDKVQAHYDAVAGRFGIDPAVVHSWHAGIHPGCVYRRPAAGNPDRWSNSVFTHPRFLHFHTCGDYAPGEICWMLLDHSVAVDGEWLWRDGALRVEAFPATAKVFERWSELAALFERPSQAIGVSE